MINRTFTLSALSLVALFAAACSTAAVDAESSTAAATTDPTADASTETATLSCKTGDPKSPLQLQIANAEGTAVRVELDAGTFSLLTGVVFYKEANGQREAADTKGIKLEVREGSKVWTVDASDEGLVFGKGETWLLGSSLNKRTLELRMVGAPSDVRMAVGSWCQGYSDKPLDAQQLAVGFCPRSAATKSVTIDTSTAPHQDGLNYCSGNQTFTCAPPSDFGLHVKHLYVGDVKAESIGAWQSVKCEQKPGTPAL